MGAGAKKKATQKTVKDSFEKALLHAYSEWAPAHAEQASALFDASFLEREAGDLLAQAFLASGHVDPSQLALAWAQSLNKDSSATRTTSIREMEPAAASFLRLFLAAAQSEEPLARLLNAKRLADISESLDALVAALDAKAPTHGTRLDYLGWQIARNSYVDPRGISQTQRQVQLRLDAIYVGLDASADSNASARLPNASTDQEARFEADGFHGRFSLDAIAADRPLTVILGDPGAGKTTLLRHLALVNARAFFESFPGEPPEERRFPLLVRIAEYAQDGRWRSEGFGEFISAYHDLHECPALGCTPMLEAELAAGNCLILLDGLDEVVEPDDRRAIVGRVEDFVRRHIAAGNHFLVSSRVAGCSEAPLMEQFAHFRVRDMERDQVEQFLNSWCPAVEEAQTPDLPPEVRAVAAQREIDGILLAIDESPGVARLATNPLLLTVLTLIHRTGARLPQKRIELYKTAATTLSRTWRTAQGVPESALVEEQYLNRLLGRLAHWMHNERPAGVINRAEAEEMLGREFAALRRVEWDEDDPDPSIVTEVKAFLEAVRIQTGLFVERASNEYGFMHLTFEEYFVARHLVAKPRQRARLIREHLHRARWEEPILLALGFIGLDFQDEAAELVETAILARGSEAAELGFGPSAGETILGRDFRFAVRCLADQIPVDAAVANELLDRVYREVVERRGSGAFEPYRRVLLQVVAMLVGTSSGEILFSRARSVVATKFPRHQAKDLLAVLAGTAPSRSEYVRAALDVTKQVAIKVADLPGLNAVASLTPAVSEMTANGPGASTESQALLLLEPGSNEPGLAAILGPKMFMASDVPLAIRISEALRSMSPETRLPLLTGFFEPLKNGQSSPGLLPLVLQHFADGDVVEVAKSALVEETRPEVRLRILKVVPARARDEVAPDWREEAHLALASDDKVLEMLGLEIIDAAADLPHGALETLKAASPSGQKFAVLARRLGGTEEDFEVLFKAAEGIDRAADIEGWLSISLGHFAGKSAAFKPVFLAILGRPDVGPARRAFAVRALSSQRRLSPEIRSAIRPLTKDPELSVRAAAFEALLAGPGRHEQTASVVEEALRVGDESIVDTALELLRTAARSQSRPQASWRQSETWLVVKRVRSIALTR